MRSIPSNTEETDCQDYACVNDIPPIQNLIAEGNKGECDFSEWSFEYTYDCQLIEDRENEITAKITCFDSGLQPISEWHSINVTWIGNC